jgi:hypothetical protein
LRWLHDDGPALGVHPQPAAGLVDQGGLSNDSVVKLGAAPAEELGDVGDLERASGRRR